MYCVNCATELQPSWKHCPSCGESNVSSRGDVSRSAAKQADSSEPPVPYTKAQRELDPATYEALVAAGKPELVRRNGKIEPKYGLDKDALIECARSVLSPTSFKIWQAAGYPDVNDFVAGLEEQLGEVEAPSRPSYNVRYIVSEQELKQWWDRNVLKVWKKRGKPRVVIIDEVRVMYEVQLNFYEHYGYEMSGDMVDAWYWVGCPNIKVWDVQGTMERYFQTAQQILGMQAQSSNLFGAIATGFSEIGGSIVKSPQNSGLNSKALFEGQLINQCSRCGTPLIRGVCRYCQK